MAFIGTQNTTRTRQIGSAAGMSRTCSGTKPFSLSAPATRQIYADAYERTRALYCRDRPSLDAIPARLDAYLDRL